MSERRSEFLLENTLVDASIWFRWSCELMFGWYSRWFIILGLSLLHTSICAEFYLNIATILKYNEKMMSQTQWHSIHSERKSFERYDCMIQFIGYLIIDMNEEIYWLHGNGSLIDENNIFKNLTPSPIVQCQYVTVTGVEANHQQDNPNTLNIAIRCGIKTKELCDDLRSKKNTFKVTIYPEDIIQMSFNSNEYLSKYVLAYNRSQNIHYQPTRKKSIPSSQTSSIVWNPIPNPNHLPDISIQYHNFTNLRIFPVHSEHSVCVVQTFRNLMTPSMLYLFVEYYLSLGWTIILFDRHGYHQDIIKQRYLENKFVIYYSFTILQLLFPSTLLSGKGNSPPDQGFKYYSYHGAYGFLNSTKAILQNNEEAQDDADRRKTFQLANQLYSHTTTVLYADRDEFFYCRDGPKSPLYSLHSIQQQVAIQSKFFHTLSRNSVTGVRLRRFAHLPRYPSLTPNISITNSLSLDDILHININQHLAECMNKGYQFNDTQMMWSCWSHGTTINAKPKCLEMKSFGLCPLVGVHEICMRSLANIQYSTKCHFIHLNGIYIKPKSIIKLGELIYQPLQLFS